LTSTECVSTALQEQLQKNVPLAYDRDDEAIADAWERRLRWAIGGWLIKNTLELEYLWVSETLWRDSPKKEHLEIVAQPQALPFDSSGNLPFGVFNNPR
jgi:hypothetical protein